MDIDIITKNRKILVFRSDIDHRQKKARVRRELLRYDNIYRVDVDLDDCDKVLRVECHQDLQLEQVKWLITTMGYSCSKLA